MTDKELDNAIKTALTSDEVPPSLNHTLLKRTQKKNNRAKIYSFTKLASAIAAIFICAIAVLSFHNSDEGESMKLGLVKGGAENKDTLSKSISEKDAAPNHTDSADFAQNSPADSARIVNDVSKAPQNVQEKATAESASEARDSFAFGKKAQTLSGLFKEGYDFKGVINEQIDKQIKSFGNASEYNFSGISENVGFAVDEKNILTIIFDAGEIVSPEHGEQYFTVGTIADGILK